jgi:hypothetical protein
MRRQRVPAAPLCLVMLFAMAGSLRAQTTRPLQIGAGYQLLHESVDRGSQTFPAGAYASVERVFTARPSASFAWIGEFETGYRRDSGYSEQIYSVLGGIRAAGAGSRRWIPSGFGLIGAGVQNASCETYCEGTDSGLALEAGVTLTTRLTRAILLDLGFKAAKLRLSQPGVFNAALLAGVRFDLTR